MIKHLISVDVTKPVHEQPVPLHNRWHPEIPAVASVEAGDTFYVECLDWTGGQIKNNNNPDDVAKVDLTQVHYLSGPIAIKDAQPGDLLVVEILDIGALPESPWGFTGIFDKNNGGGFLCDRFPHAAKAIWDLEGIYTSSRHIPGVRFIGMPHLGLIGCAPSPELLTTWNSREKALKDTNPNRVPALAELPNPQGALLGNAKNSRHVAETGARTVPPRENGGNCDIRHLTRGSKIYFPVFVPGALLSLGDIHFSQGDGEISFCGGIEMAGWVSLKVQIIENGIKKFNIKGPMFERSLYEPMYRQFLGFEGISVDEQGKQHYLDAHIAYRQAALHAIDYLTQFDFTPEQAYLLLSAAPVEGHISGIVDYPNACCTLNIPLEIFEKNIHPY